MVKKSPSNSPSRRPTKARCMKGMGRGQDKLGFYRGSEVTKTSVNRRGYTGRRMNLATNARSILNSCSADRVAPVRRTPIGRKPATSNNVPVVLASSRARKEKRKLVETLKKKQCPKLEEDEKERIHGRDCWLLLKNSSQVRECTTRHIENGDVACIIECWRAFPGGMKIVIMETVVQSRAPLLPQFANAVSEWAIECARSDDSRARESAKGLVAKITNELSRLVQQDEVICEFLDKLVLSCHGREDDCFDVIKPLVSKVIPSFVFVLQRHRNGLSVLLKCTRLMTMDDGVVFEEILKNSVQIHLFEFGCRAIENVMAAAPSSLRHLQLGTSLTHDVVRMVKQVVSSRFKPDVFHQIIEMRRDYSETIARCVIDGMDGIVRDVQSDVTSEGLKLTDGALKFYENDPDEYPREWMSKVNFVREWYLRKLKERTLTV